MNLTNIGRGVKKYPQNDHVTGLRNHAQCYFVPPRLLEKLIEETQDPKKRRKLARALQFSATARTARKFQNLQGAVQRSTLRELALQTIPKKQRFVYDVKHKSDPGLPGKLVRSEDQPPTGDSDADKAYDNSGHTWDFYYEVFKRVSIDNSNIPLKSCVHYEEDLDNAMWDGTYMIYGDGGGGFIKKGTLTNLDVCGHELTHGVTENESSLGYSGEMGGLNEGFSDIFGAMINQKVNNLDVDNADGWLIGKGIIEESAFPAGQRDKVRALRDMANPGTAFPGDSQISHYRDFDPGMDPHTSSGIPNKAFWKTCTEIAEKSGIKNSWEKAGMIWYVSLRDAVKSDSQFIDVANSTYALAGQLFGDDPKIQEAVKTGWNEVGIKPERPTIHNSIKLSHRFSLR
jgi:Zn-dependent metalloprotease